jgi:integrase
MQPQAKQAKFGGHGFTPKVIWAIVKANAKSCGLPSVAPHDLRRTCARLCHQAGGELDQIQFLLGHVSIQTTERYLGCKQRCWDEPDRNPEKASAAFDVRVLHRR